MDQDNLKQIAGEVISVVAEKAGKAAEVAGKVASKAAESAGGKAEDLGHRAVELGKTGIEVAAPIVVRVAEVTEAEAKKLLEKSKDFAGDTKQASYSSVADLASRGQVALADIEKHARANVVPPKKRGRAGRIVGWTAAAAGVASVTYLLWRRSRPIEDPWAEEYWVDLQSNADLDDAVEEPADVVADAVDDVVEEVENS